MGNVLPCGGICLLFYIIININVVEHIEPFKSSRHFGNIMQLICHPSLLKMIFCPWLIKISLRKQHLGVLKVQNDRTMLLLFMLNK